MKIEKQLELNRKWLYHQDGDEPYGEQNFVIKEEYFLSIFDELFSNTNQSPDNFLDSYEPETDGEKIYQRAKSDNSILMECMSYL